MMAAMTDTPYRLTGPFTHENLTLHLIHGPNTFDGTRFMPLAEALQARCVLVHETGEVGQLEVENLSEHLDLYIQAGDIVKGGRQDRTLAVDFVLPARSGRVPIPSFCVERGRWHRRANEDATQFSSSDMYLAGKKLRMAAKLGRSQAEVWRRIADSQQALAASLGEEVCHKISPSSYPLTREHEGIQTRRREFHARLGGLLSDKPDAVGYLFEVNGALSSADVYGSQDLFVKLWDKLLDAAILEALEESGHPPRKGAPESVREIRPWLDSPESGDLVRREPVPPRVELITRRTDHSVRFDTHDQALGTLLHRSLITN